jgi:hypothetical protein
MYGVDGRRVADLTSELVRAIERGDREVEVTVTGLDEGSYLYMLSTGRESVSQQFQVTR